MINMEGLKNSRGKQVTAVVVVVLLLLSWVGSLDRKSTEYVDGAIVKSTVAFGVARATNAIVSTLQSTTITMQLVGGVAVTVGEVLDPINDLVEQYASLMKLSIVSLVVQKVLLEVVSDATFKLLFTISGGLFLASLLLKNDKYVGVFFKSFIFLAFLRFILVATVLLNGAVSARFIEPKADEQMLLLSDMESQIEQAQEEAGPTILPADEQARLLSSIEALQATQEESSEELESVQERIASIEADIAEVEGEIEASFTLTQRLNPLNRDEGLVRLQSRVSELEGLLDIEEDRAAELSEIIGNSTDEITAIQNTLSGRADTLSEYVSSGISAVGDAVSLQRIVDKVQDYVPNIINVMTYFLLQTLILPLIFMFLLSKGVSLIWGIDLRRVISARSTQQAVTS